MFNNCHKCKTDMDTESGAPCDDCSKPKKSKTSQFEDGNVNENWANLPSVVIFEVFDLLDKKDRQNASSTCRNWRSNLFHPKWWPNVVFPIHPFEMKRAKFSTSVFGHIVTKAHIQVNTLEPLCVEALMALLEIFNENTHLQELFIEPTHCRIELPALGKGVDVILTALDQCLPLLTKFSIGCVEEFSNHLVRFIQKLTERNPARVTHLGLASIKDIPGDYEICNLRPTSFKCFTGLKVLSIDYDYLSDHFLSCLENASNLKRLIVHFHGIPKGHPGTTNRAWEEFCNVHPACEMRLTVMHSYKDIKRLHKKVLRQHMPLTHLKVFFCEMLNLRVLEYVASFYSKTLRSIVWVDSLVYLERSWLLATTNYLNSPEPLIMLSWLCRKLEEIVLIGYKYIDSNLIAIARLRGEGLKKLEMVDVDILPSKDKYSRADYLVDIPKRLKKPWEPMKKSELHPVLLDPLYGDSDEYLLPSVLADLKSD